MEEIDVICDVMTRKTFYITDPLWGNPPVNHLTKGQKCGALVFPFVYAWTNSLVSVICVMALR